MDWPIEPFIDAFFRLLPFHPVYGDYRPLILTGSTAWVLLRTWLNTRANGFNGTDDRSYKAWLAQHYPVAFTPMFPLTNRTVSGYRFRQWTFYLSRHLGTDYKAAVGTEVFSPADGTVVAIREGLQGGVTLFFRPDSADVTMRFMHLSKETLSFATGPVRRGQLIAKTGNTGAFTTGPHLHLDISNGKSVMQGNLNINNFLDPETWNWTDILAQTVHVPVVSAATVAPPPPPTPPAPTTFIVELAGRHPTVKTAYFRDAPSRSARVFAEYKNGTRVVCSEEVQGEVVAGSPIWYKSALNGKYIHSSVANKVN